MCVCCVCAYSCIFASAVFSLPPTHAYQSRAQNARNRHDFTAKRCFSHYSLSHTHTHNRGTRTVLDTVPFLDLTLSLCICMCVCVSANSLCLPVCASVCRRAQYVCVPGSKSLDTFCDVPVPVWSFYFIQDGFQVKVSFVVDLFTCTRRFSM